VVRRLIPNRAKLLREFSVHGPFHQTLAELLQRSLLANQALVTSVIRQQFIDQLLVNFIRSSLLLSRNKPLHKNQNTTLTTAALTGLVAT
jgi:hypothetical protein